MSDVLFVATFSAQVYVHVHKLSLRHPALGEILAGGEGTFVAVITDDREDYDAHGDHLLSAVITHGSVCLSPRVILLEMGNQRGNRNMSPFLKTVINRLFCEKNRSKVLLTRALPHISWQHHSSLQFDQFLSSNFY